VAERKRLTWEPGPYSSQRGRAGGVELFSLHWKTQRSAPNYSMQCDLPGFPRNAGENDDPELLKEHAEKLLAAWLARVTGGELWLRRPSGHA
jgi:hypothetical protein